MTGKNKYYSRHRDRRDRSSRSLSPSDHANRSRDNDGGRRRDYERERDDQDAYRRRSDKVERKYSEERHYKRTHHRRSGSEKIHEKDAEQSRGSHKRNRSKSNPRSSSSESETIDAKRRRKSRDKFTRNPSESENILEKKHKEMMEQKRLRKLQKELMKQQETPEEKRARRLAKKAAKKRKMMGEFHGNYDQLELEPADPELLKTFVWDKKLEKEGIKHLPKKEIEAMERKKREENQIELEKVRRRKIERERMMEEKEEEETRIQREKEASQMKEYSEQEELFQLKQAKERSKIRVEKGRAKPIDLLARYISVEEEENLEVEMNEPYVFIDHLSTEDLEDLEEDIKVYTRMDESRQHLDYWNDLMVIVQDELSVSRANDRRDGINPQVREDVLKVFKEKSSKELSKMAAEIERKIQSDDPGIDVHYWESLRSHLNAFKARTRLRERHEENLRSKLLQLKRAQGMKPEPIFPSAAAVAEEPQHSPEPTVEEQNPEDSPQVQATLDDLLEKTKEDFINGDYNPTLISYKNLEPGTILVEAEDDMKRLQAAREKLENRESHPGDLDEGRMEDGESEFNHEVHLKKSYLWSDKYRPRKPQYRNRVQTGYDWNKYNQTHYDEDNPPPKVVQGYKFNIYYPDLIDKSDTPTYKIIRTKDNKDFATLRFHAGPPYEDIAFTVVDREWEHSFKKGYKCEFQNGTLRLYFHFKRYRYRR